MEQPECSQFTCVACSFTFESVQWLRRHLENLSGESFHQEASFKCCKCPSSGPLNVHEYAEHLSAAHSDEIATASAAFEAGMHSASEKTRPPPEQKRTAATNGEQDEAKRFACTKCGSSFKRRANLRQHAAVHARPASLALKCSMCEKTFLSRSSLKLHFRVHTNSKPFACVFADCSEHFRTRRLMDSHVNQTHLGLSATNKNEYSPLEAQRLVRRIAELSGKKIAEDPPIKKSATSAFSSFSLRRAENYPFIYHNNQPQVVHALQRRAGSSEFPFAAPSDFRHKPPH
ncbi:hypothetical protein M3Y99_00352600 [Aphelenchoides fujianensis]|nr:hypothetical protein M3Y99_00352600 [Aphelenchoides fujianensis]